MKTECQNCGEIAAKDKLASRCTWDQKPADSRLPVGLCAFCGGLAYEISDVLRCKCCEAGVRAEDMRTHLECHNPNATGMDWEDVRNEFVCFEPGTEPQEVAAGERAALKTMLHCVTNAAITSGLLPRSEIADVLRRAADDVEARDNTAPASCAGAQQ